MSSSSSFFSEDAVSSLNAFMFPTYSTIEEFPNLVVAGAMQVSTSRRGFVRRRAP